MRDDVCIIDGCQKKVKGRAMCAMHYERVRVHGDPHITMTPQRGLPPEEQYELLVDRLTAPEGCHLWNGPMLQNGYGRVKYDGVVELAHRWGYRRYVGEIPDGLVVRHTCDVKRCQNPAHWVLGSPADNNRDRDERGRTSMGSRHPNSKLSEEDVMKIRERYARGDISQQSLAEEFGVSQFTVSTIVRRKWWKQVS